MNEKPDEAGDAGTPPKDAPADNGPDDPTDDPTMLPQEAREPAADIGSGEPAVAESRSRSGLPAALAGLALLLALAALVGVGYLTWQNRDRGGEQADTDATMASLADNLDESLESLDGLRKRLDELSERDGAYGAQIDSLERQLDTLLARYENIPARLTNLETAMTSLQGISTGVRDNWWLAEAEYYLQIANAQLQLAGNPRLARLALEFADERVRQLGNPALTDVRRELARELRALEVMEKPDVEGVAMRLASLADTVESLPLDDSVTRRPGERQPVDPDAGAFDRALASIRQAFGGVVSVRRTDEQVRPLLSPDARGFLRVNLALQMQTARLALLRNQQAVFERSLADARKWLRAYYDTDSAAVASALSSIDEIRENYVTVDAPDISGSLQLLRRYRSLASGDRAADGMGDEMSGGMSDGMSDETAGRDDADGGTQ